MPRSAANPDRAIRMIVVFMGVHSHARGSWWTGFLNAIIVPNLSEFKPPMTVATTDQRPNRTGALPAVVGSKPAAE